MKHSFELALLLSALAAFGCKNDDDGDGDGDESATATLEPQIEGALGRNNPPETSAANRIDRAGRPAISAALISTFARHAADPHRYLGLDRLLSRSWCTCDRDRSAARS